MNKSKKKKKGSKKEMKKKIRKMTAEEKDVMKAVLENRDGAFDGTDPVICCRTDADIYALAEKLSEKGTDAETYVFIAFLKYMRDCFQECRSLWTLKMCLSSMTPELAKKIFEPLEAEPHSELAPYMTAMSHVPHLTFVDAYYHVSKFISERKIPEPEDPESAIKMKAQEKCNEENKGKKEKKEEKEEDSRLFDQLWSRVQEDS